MDRKKLVAELDWMNMKSYMLVYLIANAVSVAIVLWSGVFLPVGWLGFILGGVAYVICLLVQRRMARKMADKIMKSHKEDYTIYVRTVLKAKQ